MPNNHFKWWHAIIAVVAYMVSFILNSQLTNWIAPLFENSIINHGGILNISMFIIAGVLCLLGFRFICQKKISRSEFGIEWSNLRRILLFGFLFGLGFFIISEIIEMSISSLKEAGEQVMSEFNIGKYLVNDIIVVLGIGLFAPVVEEILFRGGVFNSLWKSLDKISKIPKNLGVILSILVSSYLFMSIHGGGGQDAQIYLIFLLGALAALAMYLTNSLLAAIMVHAVNNNLVFMYSIVNHDNMDLGYKITLIVISILCLLACFPLASLFGKILPFKSS